MPTFMINDDTTTPQPQEMLVNPRPIVGRNLLGDPIYMGYETLDVKWSNIPTDRIASLLALYDPTVPACTVTYLDSRVGVLVTRDARMEQPIDGGPIPGLRAYKNVSVRFSHLGPAATYTPEGS